MELQEFIKETLVQITNGVIEAQKEIKETGCLINPQGFSSSNQQIRTGFRNEYRSIQKVKMNVLLSVSENKGKSSGINVVQIVKAGVNAEESETNNKVTSIEFEVPIAFPTMENK